MNWALTNFKPRVHQKFSSPSSCKYFVESLIKAFLWVGVDIEYSHCGELLLYQEIVLHVFLHACLYALACLKMPSLYAPPLSSASVRVEGDTKGREHSLMFYAQP